MYRWFSDDAFPDLNIPQQEIVTSTIVFGRIPHSFISGEGIDPHQTQALTAVDIIMVPTLLVTYSQEELPVPSFLRRVSQDRQQVNPSAHGKRGNPKLFINGKHVVLC